MTAIIHRNLRITPHKFLTFQRINIELDTEVISEHLGKPITDNIRDRMRLLDNSEKANLDRLDELGRKAGAKLVSADDLPRSFDPFP